MKEKMDITTKIEYMRKGHQLSIACTALMLVLMLAYLSMTISSSSKLADQTSIISDHPFEVVISAGDIKLYVSEMRIRTERLTLHKGASDVALVAQALDALSASSREPLELVESLYLGDPADVAALRNTLSLLYAGQDDYLAYAALPETTADDVEGYVREQLQPLYDQALDEADGIIAVAQAKKVGYGETADALRGATLAASIVLMVLMVGVLLISQYILWRQRKELAFRSRLFDDLSMSIDDTFLIRDAGSGAVQYRALNMERVLGVSADGREYFYQGIDHADADELGRLARDPSTAFPIEKLAEYQKPNGEKCWLLIRVYRTEDLSTPQLITVFSDRTKEVLSRQTLQDAMHNAERANMAKSDFLSRMSHEIRTPLNAVIGMTTIAAASVNNPARVEDCLSKINFSSKHLLMLINDVLDMSKIESDKMVLQNEPFDIFQVINGFVSTVYAQAKAKGLEFEESMEGFGADTTFIGDSLRLSQILLNLSSNAVKFTPPGGKIRLAVFRLASKSIVDVLRFTLSDTGIGMTPEALSHIFKPFEQADATIASRYGGTGLGMSITQNLVTLMGGHIQVESRPGAGTTCTVDLPFRRGTEDVTEPDFASQGLHALVVDDEQTVCEQTACLLDKIKIRSEWTLSGADAVERVKLAYRENRAFDFCLIDWKMADMDGLEVTRQIRRAVGTDLPIVMISSYDISSIEEEARAAGVNGFLPKPLYRSSVYSAIKDALERGVTPAAPEAPANGQMPLTGRSLLVVEDNELNREIAQELLCMKGAAVRCAADGQEALDLFLASRPGEFDAILMDVQMPVMNGYEATRLIRTSSHPEAAVIPIIATTANAFSDDISAALSSGMNAHISKPLDIAQLCRVLNECFQAHRKADNR